MFARLSFLFARLPLLGDCPARNHRRRAHQMNMSGVRIFHITAVATMLLSSLLWRIVAQDACTTSSQPNPIAQQYPETPSGTFNATLAILPIPMDTARKIIPAQYAILEGAYRELLPSFPEGMYPVLMQAGLDHDIQLPVANFSLPDFHVSSSPPPPRHPFPFLFFSLSVPSQGNVEPEADTRERHSASAGPSPSSTCSATGTRPSPGRRRR